jgi:hypothetical protein
MTSGAVFRSAKESMRMSYTFFLERLKKFEEMRLAELRAVTGRGRMREIVPRYDAETVVEVSH